MENTLYHKIIDGKVVFYHDPLVTDEFQIFNPTHEQLTEAGWIPYEAPQPAERTLQEAKEDMLRMISDYDASPEVNSFYVNGVETWLTHEERANYRGSLADAELLGEQDIDVPIAGMVLTMPIQEARMSLAQIQRYADQCAIVTARHKIAVQDLSTISEVDSYDYMDGYPEKLQFSI